MFGPLATTSRLTPIYQMSLAVLLRAACASMSTTTPTTTTTTTTTTTRDRGDRYGPMEWAQQVKTSKLQASHNSQLVKSKMAQGNLGRGCITSVSQLPSFYTVQQPAS